MAMWSKWRGHCPPLWILGDLQQVVLAEMLWQLGEVAAQLLHQLPQPKCR